ncbi:hypothetical protein [Streptomyces sp. NPDC055055]
MSQEFGHNADSEELRAEIDRSRKVARAGWVAIALVVALVVVVLLAILAGVLLFSVAAVSVN